MSPPTSAPTAPEPRFAAAPSPIAGNHVRPSRSCGSSDTRGSCSASIPTAASSSSSHASVSRFSIPVADAIETLVAGSPSATSETDTAFAPRASHGS